MTTTAVTEETQAVERGRFWAGVRYWLGSWKLTTGTGLILALILFCVIGTAGRSAAAPAGRPRAKRPSSSAKLYHGSMTPQHGAVSCSALLGSDACWFTTGPSTPFRLLASISTV